MLRSTSTTSENLYMMDSSTCNSVPLLNILSTYSQKLLPSKSFTFYEITLVERHIFLAVVFLFQYCILRGGFVPMWFSLFSLLTSILVFYLLLWENDENWTHVWSIFWYDIDNDISSSFFCWHKTSLSRSHWIKSSALGRFYSHVVFSLSSSLSWSLFIRCILKWASYVGSCKDQFIMFPLVVLPRVRGIGDNIHLIVLQLD